MRTTALVLALNTTTTATVLVLTTTAVCLALELLGTTLGAVAARAPLSSTPALLGSHLAGHALHGLVHASLNALAHAGLAAALGTARTLAVATVLVAAAV